MKETAICHESPGHKASRPLLQCAGSQCPPLRHSNGRRLRPRLARLFSEALLRPNRHRRRLVRPVWRYSHGSGGGWYLRGPCMA